MNIKELSKTTAISSEEAKKESFWNRDISLSSSKIGDKEKSVLYHQLRTLIGSGVDVKQSLELVIDQLGKKKSQEAIKEIIGNLVRGNSLYQAFDATGQFSNYELISLRIGEESGRLTEVLATLSDYFEQRMEQRRQFVSALSYPVLIVFSSLGAVAFMLLFIIPMFEEVF
ncbi:MAG: type II secretion system F family protein, partial [Bacteroidota bacterium]